MRGVIITVGGAKASTRVSSLLTKTISFFFVKLGRIIGNCVAIRHAEVCICAQ